MFSQIPPAYGSGLLSALGEQPRPECSSIEAVERGKFPHCRLTWLSRELPNYAAEIARLSQERIEREANEAWAWLAIQPVQDCNTVPELEKAKFPACIEQRGDGVSSLLASHENGVAQLRAFRDQLASDLADLRARVDRLKERGGGTQNGAAGLLAVELVPLLERLTALESQARLLSTLGSNEISSAEVGQIVSLHMDSAVSQTPLFATASNGAEAIATLRPGEAFVRIETGQADAAYIPVVHAITGLGFIERQLARQ